jgi:hypothetical protein
VSDFLEVPIRAGVYVLRNFGKVVWVGKGKCALAKVYAHMANRGAEDVPTKSLFQRLIFDSVQIRVCRVDQLDETFREVCVEVGWCAPKIPGATVTQLVDLMRHGDQAVATMRRRA